MFFDVAGLLLSKIFFFTGLVKPKGSFPKPLDAEEEKKYLALARAGDKNAKDILVKHNMRLVAHIVKKYAGAADNDDLMSVGSIGLIKAINTYNEGKGTQLATYTARCIENEILMQLRKSVKYKNEISLEEPLNSDSDGNELVLADIISTENDVVSKDLELETEKQLLWNCLKKLNYREQEIMMLRFGLNNDEEKTQKEVADLLGISQSYISRIEKKFIHKA